LQFLTLVYSTLPFPKDLNFQVNPLCAERFNEKETFDFENRPLKRLAKKFYLLASASERSSSPAQTVPKQGVTVADKPKHKSILADFNFSFHD
jgi:hypothetical protein